MKTMYDNLCLKIAQSFISKICYWSSSLAI